MLFPNLEKLVFQTKSNFLYYLFYEALTENKKFSNLRALPNPINRKQTELYYKCVDYVKSRITSIEITNYSEYDYDDDSEGPYDALLNKLDEYPKLKKIDMYIPDKDINFGNSDYTTEYFEDVIEENELRSLQHLSLTSTTDSTYLSFYTGRQDTLLSTNTLKKLYIEKCSKIYYTPCEQLLRFIMNKFSGLDTLICVEKNKQGLCHYAIPSDALTTTLL